MLQLLQNGVVIREFLPLGYVAVPGVGHVPALAGWSHGEFEIVAKPPIAIDVSLTEYAADRRWQLETGGIQINGVSVHTDDRSQTKLMAARTMAKENAGFVTPWKMADGIFVPLDAATVIAIADAVFAFIAGLFPLEQQIVAAINAGTITSREQIDDAFTNGAV